MRGVKKENIPSEVCVVCDRPFTWRKKWERCWDEVSTCSKSCNAKRRTAKQSSSSVENNGVTEAKDVCDSPPESRKEAGKPAEPAASEMAGPAGRLADQQLSPKLQQGPASADSDNEEIDEALPSREMTEREKRKADKKAMKAARRAHREGRGDGSAGKKQCDGCEKMVDLLIRCSVDESQAWRMMCGKCWRDVSGGVADGDAAHPHYRYGGLWKNRKANRDISTAPPDVAAIEALLT